MQKISTYLYPNRIQLLADLAGFSTEYTNVYQRNIKLYQGVDNVLEFDIKNADQKRIDLSTLTDIKLNVMDASGFAVGQYDVTPLDQTTLKGLASATIPSADLAGFTQQFFKYSVTHVDGLNTKVLYADSRFGALGELELVGSAVPVSRTQQVYTTSTGEINLLGEVISHSPAIPTTFYESTITIEMNVHVYIQDFIGKVYIQGTNNSTISVNSWLNAPKIMEFIFTEATTETVHFHPLDVGDYKYFMVSWENSSLRRITTSNTQGLAGKVVKITADIGPGEC
jgi:hypothetical protein